jgi:transposase
MLTMLFFHDMPGVRVDRVWREGATLHLAARRVARAARCPLCRHRSRRLHSHYDRTLADLPCAGDRVTIHLRVRRFACRVRHCPRRIFAERLPALAAAFARRTKRLAAHVLRAGFDLGGDPGVLHLAAEGITLSARTLLRLVRAAPVPPSRPVRVLGLDDWAHRRGRTYATILVNLETHTIIDLLPDREVATVATWLALHPEVQVVSRDRAGAYAEAIRQGAPQATQVADRWHLLKNIGDAVERALSRRQRLLRAAAEAVLREEQDRVAIPATSGPADPPAEAFPSAPLARSAADRAAHRVQRHARYAEVQALHQQGVSIAEIARRLHLARATARKLARAEACPERPPRPQLLTPFEPYLRYRWAQGCRNARALFEELQARGYRGSYVHLRQALRAWRTEPARHGRSAWIPTPPPPGAMPTLRPVSARQATWLLLRAEEDLDTDDRAFLAHLLDLCPEVRTIRTLTQGFCTLVRERAAAALEPWLCAAQASGCSELRGFAEGLRRDRAAVDAALTLEWSQGQTEGKVNKVKTTKRRMYGRANFDLLRQRVLHAA